MPDDIQKKHKEELKENRAKLLLRKQRTRRLIQHGAIAESFVPGSENMLPETFKEELQKLLSPTGRRTPEETERISIMPTEGRNDKMRPSVMEGSLSPELLLWLKRSGYPESWIENFRRYAVAMFPEGKIYKILSRKSPDRFLMIRKNADEIGVV